MEYMHTYYNNNYTQVESLSTKSAVRVIQRDTGRLMYTHTPHREREGGREGERERRRERGKERSREVRS